MRIYEKIALISQWNNFCLIPLRNVFLGEELQIDAKNSNFKFLKSAFNMKVWEYAFNNIFSLYEWPWSHLCYS